MPRDGNLFECSSVSQNSFSGVLYRVEPASILRWSNKEMGVVRHRGSQLVVRNAGKWCGVVGWNNWFNSQRVRPFFIESKKFLHQIVGEKSDFNPCFDEGRMPVYRLIFISHPVYNSCDLAVDQAFGAWRLRRFASRARLQRRIYRAAVQISFRSFSAGRNTRRGLLYLFSPRYPVAKTLPSFTMTAPTYGCGSPSSSAILFRASAIASSQNIRSKAV